MKRIFFVVVVTLSVAAFILSARAQEKPAAATSDKKPVTIDFKPGDAAQLVMLRVKIDQIGSALKLMGTIDYPAMVLRKEADSLNRQVSQIIESYKMADSEIIVDDNGNWVGLKKKP